MNLKEYIQEHKAEFDDLKMSPSVDEVFKKTLKNRLHQPKKGKVIQLKYISVAASLVIAISTIFWLYSENKELKKKELLLANLIDDSTGTRLAAVYEFDDAYKKEDVQIIKVLLKTLLEDKNANVKIATIDALLKFPQNEEIRKGLVKAIEKEKEPLVQIKLIKSLSLLREHRAQKPLERIINNKETFPIVKNNATLAMANLKQ